MSLDNGKIAASSPVDIDLYFQRIGYSGPRTPTWQTLRDIQYHHATSIPFENLNSLLRIPVPIDFESLQQKLLRDGRGGYCFEHNTLLQQVLTQLGFSVSGLSARVMWNAPEGELRPRTHMILRVEIDGETWLADVGMGGLTLTTPIRLFCDDPQTTSHERFRIVREGDQFFQQGEIAGEWKPTYEFGLQLQYPIDYLVSNWYVSTNLNSHFLHVLMVARPAAGRRTNLINNLLSIYPLHGKPEKRLLSTAGELRDVLENVFELTLPNHPDLDGLLTRIAATPPQP